MKIIKQFKRKIRDSYTYWKVLSKTDISRYYQAYKLTEENREDLVAAKMLHASVYLSKSFIIQEDIHEGIIHDLADPHQHHADYFVVKKKNQVIAVARQIIHKGVGEYHESFPVLEKSLIHERSRKRIAGQHPQEIVEISALVKKGGESSIVPLILYRELWRHSRKSKHRVWIMACDVRLYERLKLLFGPTLTRIGQRTPYVGGDVIPVSLNIALASNYIHKLSTSRRRSILDVQRRAAKFMMMDQVK